MKLRSVLAALLAAAFLLLGGCSLFGLDIERPSDVYLQYDLSDAASEVAVDRGPHTVVSLVSIGNFSDKLTFGTIVKISSGVIVDREGYILSSDTALRPTFTDPEDGVTYTGTWTSVYSVLPDGSPAKCSLFSPWPESLPSSQPREHTPQQIPGPVLLPPAPQVCPPEQTSASRQYF